MSKVERHYWDSSVFIALIRAEQGRANVCEAILRMAQREEIVLLTSAVTLAEVVRPRHKGEIAMTEAEDKKIVDFLGNPFIRLVDFSPALGLMSRKLQWKFGLLVRDAIHLATAIHSKADFFESYDSDFLKVDRNLVVGCPVMREPAGKPLPLFDGQLHASPAPTLPPSDKG